MTQVRPQRWQELEERYARSPIHLTLGLSLTVLHEGEVEIRYDGSPPGTNSRGNPSGGLLAQMVDSCVMQAALTHLAEGDFITTLELKVNYLRAATAGEPLLGHGRLEFIGRTTAVGVARVRDGSGQIAALGTLTAALRRQN